MNPKDYMVNKNNYIMHDNVCYIYDQELPEALVIPKDWIDQRVLILRKNKKEETFQKSIKTTKNSEKELIKGDK